MDPSHLWILLVSLFNAIKVALDVRKTSLDATEAATEMFNSGKKLLHIDTPDKDEEPVTDPEVARAHAAADLIRSYAFFGLLEYLLWATRAIAVIWAVTHLADNALRRFARQAHD